MVSVTVAAATATQAEPGIVGAATVVGGVDTVLRRRNHATPIERRTRTGSGTLIVTVSGVCTT